MSQEDPYRCFRGPNYAETSDYKKLWKMWIKMSKHFNCKIISTTKKTSKPIFWWGNFLGENFLREIFQGEGRLLGHFCARPSERVLMTTVELFVKFIQLFKDNKQQSNLTFANEWKLDIVRAQNFSKNLHFYPLDFCA